MKAPRLAQKNAFQRGNPVTRALENNIFGKGRRASNGWHKHPHAAKYTLRYFPSNSLRGVMGDFPESKQGYAHTYKHNKTKQPWNRICFLSRSPPRLTQPLLHTFSFFSSNGWHQMYFSQQTSGATCCLLHSPNTTPQACTLMHTCPGTCLSHRVPEHPSWLQHL